MKNSQYGSQSVPKWNDRRLDDSSGWIIIESSNRTITCVCLKIVIDLGRHTIFRLLSALEKNWGAAWTPNVPFPGTYRGYPLRMINIAMENCHLEWVFSLKMVIVHSYVKSPEGTCKVPGIKRSFSFKPPGNGTTAFKTHRLNNPFQAVLTAKKALYTTYYRCAWWLINQRGRSN